MMQTGDYNALRNSILRDPEAAAAYLNDAYQEGDQRALADAIRTVMVANGELPEGNLDLSLALQYLQAHQIAVEFRKAA